MTTSIKKAGSNLIESTKNIANNICSDGHTCDTIGWVFVSAWIFATMWLSFAQL